MPERLRPGGEGSATFVRWGSRDGSYQVLPVGGTTSAAGLALPPAAGYRARTQAGEWTCEWRLPWTALGMTPGAGARLAANLSVHRTADGAWVAWMATGGAFYEVAHGGAIILAP